MSCAYTANSSMGAGPGRMKTIGMGSGHVPARLDSFGTASWSGESFAEMACQMGKPTELPNGSQQNLVSNHHGHPVFSSIVSYKPYFAHRERDDLKERQHLPSPVAS